MKAAKAFRGLTCILSLLLAISIGLTSGMFSAEGHINRFLGIETTVLVPKAEGVGQASSARYPSSFSADIAHYTAEEEDAKSKAADEFIEWEIEESAVLLRNNNHALPLTKEEMGRVSLFGRATVDPYFKSQSGGGEGGAGEHVDYLAALGERGFTVNETLLNAYRADQSPKTITIAAAGTIYAPKAVRESAQEGMDHYDFTTTFEGLSGALAGADLSVVTLETTLAGREKGYGNYNTSPQLLDALRAVGVNFVSLATERALDKGYDGLDITASELTSRSMGYAGVYPDGVNTGAAMLNVGGVQVAVLAYAYGLSDEGRERTKGDSRGVVALMETQRVTRDIAQARVDGANIVVVLPHWGTKNRAQTPDTVHAMAERMAQAGADVILGAHPNVVQGVERISTVRSDGLTYETVVCYSLGCLLTDARDSENTAGMAVRLEMTYDPAVRRVWPGALEVTPLYIARQREDSGIVYRVVNAQDEQALEKLTLSEQAAAAQAAERVKNATQEE